MTNNTGSSVTLSWTPGSGGTQQLIRVGPNASDVLTGCSGGTCVAAASLGLTTSTYTVTGLTPGTTYYWRVVEYYDSTNWMEFGGGCAAASEETFTASAGSIQKRAVQVSAGATCTDVRAVATGGTEINGTQNGFLAGSASTPTPLIQSGSNYVTFSNIAVGSYTVSQSLPNTNWVLEKYCLKNATTSVLTDNVSSGTLVNGQTLVWEVGYTLGTTWVQTEGGDVYASGTLKSIIPIASPQVNYFSMHGAPAGSGYPGVVVNCAG